MRAQITPKMMMKRLLAVLCAPLFVLVAALAPATPAGAVTPPPYYFWQFNSGTKIWYIYQSTGGLNQTVPSPTNGTCGSCYAYTYIRHDPGAPAASSSKIRYGGYTATIQYPASWGFQYANHEVKYKVSGTCYVQGAQFWYGVGISSQWGPFVVAC